MILVSTQKINCRAENIFTYFVQDWLTYASVQDYVKTSSIQVFLSYKMFVEMTYDLPIFPFSIVWSLYKNYL